MGVGGPWRVSMDELMDKNLPYFVGGNLATLVGRQEGYPACKETEWYSSRVSTTNASIEVETQMPVVAASASQRLMQL